MTWSALHNKVVSALRNKSKKGIRRKMVLTLYVNDPMGKRCRVNLEAAKKVQEEYPVHLKVIKKGSEEYNVQKDPPPCPSIHLDGRVLKEYGVMSSDEIMGEILRFLA